MSYGSSSAGVPAGEAEAGFRLRNALIHRRNSSGRGRPDHRPRRHERLRDGSEDKILGIRSTSCSLEYSGVMRDPDRVLERVRRTERRRRDPFIYAKPCWKRGPQVSRVVLRGMDTATASGSSAWDGCARNSRTSMSPAPASGVRDLRGLPGIVVGKGWPEPGALAVRAFTSSRPRERRRRWA